MRASNLAATVTDLKSRTNYLSLQTNFNPTLHILLKLAGGESLRKNAFLSVWKAGSLEGDGDLMGPNPKVEKDIIFANSLRLFIHLT
jgi:hypothetical protein